MAISSPGIGSQLNVSEIISRLMEIERAPLAQIATKTKAMQSKISAMGSVQSTLSAFKDAIAAMATPSGIRAYGATSSDPTAISATATGAAGAAGSYSLHVTSLAQSQKLVAAGQQSTSQPIGAGKITFEFGAISGGTLSADGKYSGATFTGGTASAKSVTIEPGATSLADIRDSINKAGIGVTAAIVNDGSSAGAYRLVLTDTATGRANSMRISVDGDPELTGLLSHDPASSTSAGQSMSETRTASDAQFTVDGVRMTRDTNVLTDVIDGVSLNLVKTMTSAADITVSSNSTGVTESIKKFVDGYNQVQQTLKKVTAYDPATNVAATLNGDPTIRALQSQMHSMLAAPISGSTAAITRLYEIGVSIQANGTMAIDNAKLQKALAADPNAVTSLFTEIGKASDSSITYESAGAKSKPGNYAVTVGKLATPGSFAGSSAAGLSVTPGVNDAFEIDLNGVKASIKLAAGTYSAAGLASEIQSKVNAAPAFRTAGLGITVSSVDGILQIQSTAYGSASTIAISPTASGSDPQYYFGSSPAGQPGTDVTGTINGVPATGSGQVLTGALGDLAEGIKIRIAGGPEDAVRGSISYTQGYASQLMRALDSILGSSGAIANATTNYNASIKRLDKDSVSINSRLEQTQKRLLAQYTALDVKLGALSSTSSYLSQQLAGLSNTTS